MFKNEENLFVWKLDAESFRLAIPLVNDDVRELRPVPAPESFGLPLLAVLLLVLLVLLVRPPSRLVVWPNAWLKRPPPLVLGAWLFVLLGPVGPFWFGLFGLLPYFCSMYFLTTLGVAAPAAFALLALLVLFTLAKLALVAFRLDMDVPTPLLAVDDEADGFSKLLRDACWPGFRLLGPWAVTSCFSSE